MHTSNIIKTEYVMFEPEHYQGAGLEEEQLGL